MNGQSRSEEKLTSLLLMLLVLAASPHQESFKPMSHDCD